MKRAVHVALSTAIVLILAGCASVAQPLTGEATSPQKTDVTLAQNVTGESLCHITRNVLAPVALPGVAVDDQMEQHGRALWCVSSGDAQLAKVTVNYDLFNVTERASTFALFVDGSANAKEQCPKGASLPEVSIGMPDETAMICDRNDRSVFEYAAASPNGGLSIRVERAAKSGPITSAEAQSWLTAATKGLVTACTSCGGASEDSTGKSASDNSAAGVCEGYLTAIKNGSDPTVAHAEWLSPQEYSKPLGIDLPKPDCALRIETVGGTVTYNLGWTDTDFFEVHAALTKHGLKSTPWDGENGQRKYMLTGQDGAGLFWLDSGDGITRGTPVDDVLFVYAE